VNAGGSSPRGALLRVWGIVRAARGAVTAAQVARAAGLDAELAAAALDWLVRHGHLQRWDDGRVCATPQGMACQWCALRAWCDRSTNPPKARRQGEASQKDAT